MIKVFIFLNLIISTYSFKQLKMCSSDEHFKIARTLLPDAPMESVYTVAVAFLRRDAEHERKLDAAEHERKLDAAEHERKLDAVKSTFAKSAMENYYLKALSFIAQRFAYNVDFILKILINYVLHYLIIYIGRY